MQEKDALDMGQLVLGVHDHLSRSNNKEGLQILTSISRQYPDVVNSLLIDKLLDKVMCGGGGNDQVLSALRECFRVKVRMFLDCQWNN